MAKTKNKKWTIKTAEAAIKVFGEIEDDKIIVPDNIHDFRGQDGYEEFWSANTYLRSEHDYDSSMDDVLIWF
jgi:hypothetical protein